jgi:hypothetical protein
VQALFLLNNEQNKGIAHNRDKIVPWGKNIQCWEVFCPGSPIKVKEGNPELLWGSAPILVLLLRFSSYYPVKKTNTQFYAWPPTNISLRPVYYLVPTLFFDNYHMIFTFFQI